MPTPLRRLTFIIALALIALLGLVSSRASAAPLLTGFLDEDALYTGTDGNTLMQRVTEAGGSTVRIIVYWRTLAPVKPVDPTDPAAYDWTELDDAVRNAKLNGIEPIIDIARAPDWAERGDGPYPGAMNPDPQEFGRFARAAARRYSGTYDPGPGGVLPRVKYWTAWNEPNLQYFLQPQYVNGRSHAPELYRALLNAFATNVHQVNGTNVVIAGETAPRGFSSSHKPLDFARKVLCLSSTKPYRSVCKAKAQFDAWSTHPYTWGGPTTKAPSKGDVFLGDLPELRKVLNAATSLKKVVKLGGSAQKSVPLWATEFSWDSNAPDPDAVPQLLHMRWTSEALYRMWNAGVRAVVWFTVRDRPLGTSPNSFWQSGFWYCGAATTLDDLNSKGLCAVNMGSDVEKPSLEAFRFPFVAFAGGGNVSVWGRKPPGASGNVLIQRSPTKSGTYKTVKTLSPGGGNTFTWRQTTSWKTGWYRAYLAGLDEPSVPFSLTRPKNKILHPFGCGGDVVC
jgi:hypothetical protein